MPRLASWLLTATIVVYASACGGAAAPKTPPEAAAHSLSGLAAQHVAVLPAYSVRVMPDLGWSIGDARELQRTLDAEVRAALDERGVRRAWIFPEQLLASHQRNGAYSPDPYALAEEPLRSPNLAVGVRLPEPLASQVRSIVAFHEDTRFVLAPVELRLEKAGTGGRGVLRVVLIDARLSMVRWLGEISSEPVATLRPAITASIGAKLADVVAVP